MVTNAQLEVVAASAVQNLNTNGYRFVYLSSSGVVEIVDNDCAVKFVMKFFRGVQRRRRTIE